MKVAILGGGLTAAYAWRACLDKGITPALFAEKRFVPRGGFIYAHWLPPSVNSAELWSTIFINSLGTEQGYSEKMWGLPGISTSFPERDHHVRGVDPAEAAMALWGSPYLVRQQLIPGMLSVEDIIDIKESHDKVIQTFLPNNPLITHHTPIWVVPVTEKRTNVVVYNGMEDTPTTRVSRLFGFDSYEFPPIAKVYYDVNSPERKFGRETGLDNRKGARVWYAPEIPPFPLSEPTGYGDAEPHTLYVGRWASGQRKFLSHEAYQLVQDFLAK